ncbi:hypothetical protein Tco_0332698 [Tanacetum coccineum]
MNKIEFVGRGCRKPNRGGRKAGKLGTCGETRNLGLRKLTDEWGPHKIRFEFNDRGTLLPLGDHAAEWSNLIRKIFREFPMYYPSWNKIKEEKKAGVLGILRADWDTQIDYWLDTKNAARGLQNAQNRAKSKVFCRKGSRSLAVLRDLQMESFETQEYPSLIQTYFDTLLTAYLRKTRREFNM